MKGIEINQENVLAAEKLIPENTPFLMLNLLRYKERADYGAGQDQPQLTGQEVYLQRYVPAFVELASSCKDVLDGRKRHYRLKVVSNESLPLRGFLNLPFMQ